MGRTCGQQVGAYCFPLVAGYGYGSSRHMNVRQTPETSHGNPGLIWFFDFCRTKECVNNRLIIVIAFTGGFFKIDFSGFKSHFSGAFPTSVPLGGLVADSDGDFANDVRATLKKLKLPQNTDETEFAVTVRSKRFPLVLVTKMSLNCRGILSRTGFQRFTARNLL